MATVNFCLPYPPDLTGTVPHLEIPYVAKYPYDFTLPNIFENFARGCGFKNYDRPPEELAALMQSWLFFGLVSEVCAKEIDHYTLVRTRRLEGRDVHFIDSRLDIALDDLITTRFDSLATLSSRRAKIVWKTIKACLLSAEQKSLIFENIPSAAGSSLPTVALSVQLLLQWLKLKYEYHRRIQNRIGGSCRIKICNLTSRIFDAHTKEVLNHFDRTPLSAGVLIERLHDRGWCPHRILNTCSSLSYATLYFLSSMRLQSPTRQSHSDCTVTECITKAKSFNAIHRDTDCTCSAGSEIKPDMEAVKTIIAMDGIPLIEAKKDPKTGKMEIKVVKANPFTRYTAISHVWSDRQLGSTKNSVPLCQLEHLIGRIKCTNKGFGPGYQLFDKICSKFSGLSWRCGFTDHASDGEDLFWLDTFCVPNEELEEDPENRCATKKLRLKAINMMDLIYSNANEVLVLDRELEAVKGGVQPTPMSGEGLVHPAWQTHLRPSDDRLMEVLACTFASNWMGRAWTLQEAVLARRCVIQLQDSTLDTRCLGRHATRAKVLRREIMGTSSLRPFRNRWATIRQSPGVSNNSHCDSVKDGSVPILRLIQAVVLTIVTIILLPLEILAAYVDPYDSLDFVRREADLLDPEGADVDSLILYELGSCIRETLEPPDNLKAEDSYDVRSSSERFKIVWNALVGRSTTKPEDLHVILANLLGFNAGFMMQHCSKPEDRMNAIFSKLEEIPLDILFLNVAKEKINEEAVGIREGSNWMPLYPGKGRLDVRAKMVRKKLGYALQLNKDPDIFVFAAKAVPMSTRQFCLTSYLAVARADAPDEYEQQYWVEDLGSNSQSYQSDDHDERETYIIFHDSSRPMCTGARFVVTKHKGDNIILQYDCAILVWKDNPMWEANTPAFQARVQPIGSVLLLEHDRHPQPTGAVEEAPTARPRLPRRPMNYSREDNTRVENLSHVLGFFSLVSMLTIIISFGLHVIAPSPNRAFRTAAGIILLLLTHTTMVYWYLIPRAIMKYILRIAYHKAWAATFREDWKPGDRTNYQWIIDSVEFVCDVTGSLLYYVILVCTGLFSLSLHAVKFMYRPFYRLYKWCHHEEEESEEEDEQKLHSWRCYFGMHDDC